MLPGRFSARATLMTIRKTTLSRKQILMAPPTGRGRIPLQQLNRQVVACTLCPRLRKHCEHIATVKKAAYRHWDYWAKPVPGFGDINARLWIIGLAPGAHGANRTGRMFTGDRSGDFLYAALHRAGFANQPTSISREDGLVLTDCYISAAIRCAPPANKPLPREIANCACYLDREWDLLLNKRVILALGRIAWDAAMNLCRRHGCAPRHVPFAHRAMVQLAEGLTLVGSYHVSQQNTFTGRLTVAMFDRLLKRIQAVAGSP
jgi:uracil-DNA glycosylase family 4